VKIPKELLILLFSCVLGVFFYFIYVDYLFFCLKYRTLLPSAGGLLMSLMEFWKCKKAGF